jgi:hypothetical protein
MVSMFDGSVHNFDNKLLASLMLIPNTVYKSTTQLANASYRQILVRVLYRIWMLKFKSKIVSSPGARHSTTRQTRTGSGSGYGLLLTRGYELHQSWDFPGNCLLRVHVI